MFMSTLQSLYAAKDAQRGCGIHENKVQQIYECTSLLPTWSPISAINEMIHSSLEKNRYGMEQTELLISQASVKVIFLPS